MGPGLYRALESGFTDGPVGVGVDAMGQLGIKLDSSRDRRNTGLLPFGPNSQEPVDDYSELGLTGKLRVSKSTLRLGTLQPILPVVVYNDTRLLASTFQGGLLTSQELDGLTFNGGRLTKANLRDSSGRDDIGYGAATSDHFDFGGGSYAITPQTSVSYYYAKLEDIYRQQFVGLIDTRPGRRLEPAQRPALLRQPRRRRRACRQHRQPQLQRHVHPGRAGPQVHRHLAADVRRQRLPVPQRRRPVHRQPGHLQHLHPRRAGLLAVRYDYDFAPWASPA
jgi:hypothetical protein